MTRAKYCCNCTELNPVPQFQLLINFPFLFKTEQRLGSFGIPVLANHALVIAASKQQIARFAGVPSLSSLFLLEARLCHHSAERQDLRGKKLPVSDDGHLSIPRQSKTEKEGALLSVVWHSVSSTKPSELLQVLFVVRFLGELLNSLFTPQVSKGCLPQEDSMRDSLRLFRISFRSRGDSHHAKSHYRKRKADYRICLVPPWALLCCVSPNLCVRTCRFQWAEIQQLRRSSLILFICLKSRTPYNGGRRKMKDVIFTTKVWLLENLSMYSRL